MDIKRFFEKKDKYIRVDFTKEELEPAITFARHMGQIKKGQSNFKIDNMNIEKRFMTGAIAELAVEKVTGLKFADLEIRHDKTESKFHDRPDLESVGFNLGVKACDMYQLPLIKAYNKYDQVICIRENKSTVYICGIAKADVLNKYQSEDYVLSKTLRDFNEEKRKKGGYATKYIKTAFYGFDYLSDFNDYFIPYID